MRKVRAVGRRGPGTLGTGMARTGGTRSGNGAAGVSGGGRFELRALPGTPGVMVKLGSRESLAREAAGLRRVAGRRVAPALVEAAEGLLKSELLEGRPRRLERLEAGDLRALGALVRRVHEIARRASGGLPAWRSPARTLRSYRSRRAGDAAALAGPARASLAATVIEGLPELPGSENARPFRLLHGDLVGENVVWTPQGPRLVDWEFWRMGDPAEDLAYLAETNALPARALDAVLHGYGEPGMDRRVDAWRALVALDAGAWYAREGCEDEAQRLLRRAARLSGAP
jgi:aminoglycoside phosphotransferase (APT) family kinase protein